MSNVSKLNNIQLLRGLAAFGVVCYHSGIETATVCGVTGQHCAYSFGLGGMGVQLFFQISGFIMVVTSWKNFGMPNAPWDFLRRRIQRIVPLYWLITTLAVAGVWFVPSMLNVDVMGASYIAASYLFWPFTRVNGLVRPIANLGWTLNLEMMFYVIFSLSLFFNRTRGMLYAIGFLLFLSLLQISGLFSAAGAFPSTPLNFWGDPIILNFLLGMGVGVAYCKGLRLDWKETATLLVVAVILLFSMLNLMPIFAALPENHIIQRGLEIPQVLALFAGAALGPQAQGRNLLQRFGLLVGEASYSLYLIHPFVLRVLTKVWLKVVGAHLPIFCFTALCVVGALMAGFVLYRLVENPLNRHLGRSDRKSAAAHPPSVVPA